MVLSLIHISEPTRQAEISYAVFCLQASNLGKTSTREKQELKNLHLISRPLPLRWIGDGDVRLSGLNDLDSFIQSSKDMRGIRPQLTKN